jgi:hypothetical protein
MHWESIGVISIKERRKLMELKAIYVTETSGLILDKWFRDNISQNYPVYAREFMGMIVVISQRGWFPHSVENFHEHFKWVEINANGFSPVELTNPFVYTDPK